MIRKQKLMKRKKLSFSRSRKILGLLCVGGLLLLGFTQAFGQYSLSQLQQEPLSLPVPVLMQSRGTSCGEAVIAMTYNYAYPDTPITEQEVIEYATANGYFTEGVPPFTSPANMLKIAKNYSEDVSTGTVLSSGQGLSLLKQRLRNREPVIIDVLSDFSNLQSEAHFVVVTGISLDPARNNAVIIHYNDPLTGTQESDEWAGSQGVWNAWRTNGDPGGAGWWLVIAPPE
jgi:peptidase C39-like protein